MEEDANDGLKIGASLPPPACSDVLGRDLDRAATALGDPPSHALCRTQCFWSSQHFTQQLHEITWDSSRSLAEGLECLSPIFQLDSSEVRRSLRSPK